MNELKNCTAFPKNQPAYTCTLSRAVATGVEYEQYATEDIARDAKRDYNRLHHAVGE